MAGSSAGLEGFRGIGFEECFCFLRRLRQKHSKAPSRSKRPTPPPTAPPIIAPVWLEVPPLELAGVLVAVGIARVGDRVENLACREKYTGRSRLSQVDGLVSVAPPVELAQLSASPLLEASKAQNLPSTDLIDDGLGYVVVRDIRVEEIPHGVVRSILSEVEIMRTPNGWSIAVVVGRKGSTNDEHLRTIDDIASQAVVRISGARFGGPPFDPSE